MSSKNLLTQETKIISRKDLDEETCDQSEHIIEPNGVSINYLEASQLSIPDDLNYISKQNDDSKSDIEEENINNEFEFNLFLNPTEKNSKENNSNIIKLDLENNNDESSSNDYESASINQARPDSYYFSNYDKEKIKEFEQAAISLEQLAKERSIPWPATFQPHRVINLSEYNKQFIVKRKRPGKKRRQILKEKKLKQSKKKTKNLISKMIFKTEL